MDQLGEKKTLKSHHMETATGGGTSLQLVPSDFLVIEDIPQMILDQVVLMGVLRPVGVRAAGVVRHTDKAELILSSVLNSSDHTLKGIKGVLEYSGIDVLAVEEEEKTILISLEIPVGLLERHIVGVLLETWSQYTSKDIGTTKAAGLENKTEHPTPGKILPISPGLVSTVFSHREPLSVEDHRENILRIIRKYGSRSCFGKVKSWQGRHLVSRLIYVEDVHSIRADCLEAGYTLQAQPTSKEGKVAAFFDLASGERLPDRPAPVTRTTPFPLKQRHGLEQIEPGPQEILARLVVQSMSKRGVTMMDFASREEGPKVTNSRVTPNGAFISFQMMTDDEVLKFIINALTNPGE